MAIAIYMLQGKVLSVTCDRQGEEVLVVEDGVGTQVLRATLEAEVEAFVKRLRQGRSSTALGGLMQSAEQAATALVRIRDQNGNLKDAVRLIDEVIAHLERAKLYALDVAEPGLPKLVA